MIQRVVRQIDVVEFRIECNVCSVGFQDANAASFFAHDHNETYDLIRLPLEGSLKSRYMRRDARSNSALEADAILIGWQRELVHGVVMHFCPTCATK